MTVRGSTLERNIFLCWPMRQYRRGQNAASPSDREGEAAAPIGSNLSRVDMILAAVAAHFNHLRFENGAERGLDPSDTLRTEIQPKTITSSKIVRMEMT